MSSRDASGAAPSPAPAGGGAPDDTIGVGLVARCSRGRVGLITGHKRLPWGDSWVGIGLDDGTQWASRNPVLVADAELYDLGERAPSPGPTGSAGEPSAPLPCPFCGGAALLKSVEHGKGSEERDWYYRCRSCACEGPWFKAQGLALRFWNTRAAAAGAAPGDGPTREYLLRQLEYVGISPPENDGEPWIVTTDEPEPCDEGMELQDAIRQTAKILEGAAPASPAVRKAAAIEHAKGRIEAAILELRDPEGSRAHAGDLLALAFANLEEL